MENKERGLSPARALTALLQRHKLTGPKRIVAVTGESLTPLQEGPEENDEIRWSKNSGTSLVRWMSGPMSRHVKGDEVKLLIGAMGAPLGPVSCSSMDNFPLLSIKNAPIETSSAQYILQQYIAATGGQNLHDSIVNGYAMGKTRIVNKGASSAGETGRFVLWQMNPNMWYIELVIAGSKVCAGCDGNIVWRHTPWLGAHAAKGPPRPLRRSLQGLDPMTTSRMFAYARCIGEKTINGEDLYILKLCVDPQTLQARSNENIEIIRHILWGYFSQRTGLLSRLEDSNLMRIQSCDGKVMFYETIIASIIGDYKPVDGVMIAHSGRSVLTLYVFGDEETALTKRKMEEFWTIEEVAFNVPGLSIDCFIPPAELRRTSLAAN